MQRIEILRPCSCWLKEESGGDGRGGPSIGVWKARHQGEHLPGIGFRCLCRNANHKNFHRHALNDTQAIRIQHKRKAMIFFS